MKKIIFAVLLAALLLVSCGNSEVNSGTEAVISGETDTTEKINETAAETTAAASEFDFEKAAVVGYKTVNAGDTFEIEWKGEEFVSSHPSVCSMDGKKVTAVKKGVSLIGVEGTQQAYAVCVLPEGVSEDPMAGAPTLLEVGKSGFVEGFGSSDHYTSSDPTVAILNGSMVAAQSPGYAVIDVSNISMPKFFSFIVYDRLTDNN